MIYERERERERERAHIDFDERGHGKDEKEGNKDRWKLRHFLWNGGGKFKNN